MSNPFRQPVIHERARRITGCCAGLPATHRSPRDGLPMDQAGRPRGGRITGDPAANRQAPPWGLRGGGRFLRTRGRRGRPRGFTAASELRVSILHRLRPAGAPAYGAPRLRVSTGAPGESGTGGSENKQTPVRASTAAAGAPGVCQEGPPVGPPISPCCGGGNWVSQGAFIYLLLNRTGHL